MAFGIFRLLFCTLGSAKSYNVPFYKQSLFNFFLEKSLLKDNVCVNSKGEITVYTFRYAYFSILQETLEKVYPSVILAE